MRHWIKALLLLLAATTAVAESRVRDALLSDRGDLYVVESASSEPSPTGVDEYSGRALILRITTEAETLESVVPASLTPGVHMEPTLAFDEDDQRLYLFWHRIPNPGISELIVASYKDGEWTEPLEFGGGDIWVFRMNLRIAITHLVRTTDDNGQPTHEAAMIAHAVWWEQRGSTESARYAMLELDSGVATSVQLRELTDIFPPVEPTPFELPDDYDRDSLRQPFVFTTAASDAVQVVFANWTTNRLQIGTVQPVNTNDNGVIRIPIGVAGRETDPIPLRNQAENSSMLSAIWPAEGRLVLYATDNDAIRYTALVDNEWTPTRTIKFVEGSFTIDLAREVLRRYADRP